MPKSRHGECVVKPYSQVSSFARIARVTAFPLPKAPYHDRLRSRLVAYFWSNEPSMSSSIVGHPRRGMRFRDGHHAVAWCTKHGAGEFHPTPLRSVRRLPVPTSWQPRAPWKLSSCSRPAHSLLPYERSHPLVRIPFLPVCRPCPLLSRRFLPGTRADTLRWWCQQHSFLSSSLRYIHVRVLHLLPA